MKKKFNRVFQFKITLNEIKPSVWRRVLVPETYTFWDLHVAIQDSMGWLDCHLHEFELVNPSTGEKEHIGFPPEDYFACNRGTLMLKLRGARSFGKAPGSGLYC